MKNITTILFLSIILTLLGFYVFSTLPEINQLRQKNTELADNYDSLYNAKQRIDTIRDSIFNVKYIRTPIPVKVYDTIWEEKKYEANWYFDSIADENVEIQWEILSFGSVRHFGINYNVFKTTIIKENVVFKDRIVETPIWYPKRHLYLNGEIGSNLSYYGVDMTYHTRKQLSFKLGYRNWAGEGIYVAGVGLKIF